MSPLSESQEMLKEIEAPIRVIKGEIWALCSPTNLLAWWNDPESWQQMNDELKNQRDGMLDAERLIKEAMEDGDPDLVV